jgi:RimJ/RimL family protein N-acetyltransferase
MINMKGRNLYIREIVNEDLPQLHVWRNSDEFLDLCSNRRSKISFADFGREIYKDLSQDRFLQVLAVSKKEVPMGTLYAYRFNETDRTVFVTTYFSPEYRNFGHGVNALVLLSRYLFHEVGIYKLYMEVYSYNKGVVNMLQRVGFKEEGCLKKHRLRNGERHDLHLLAFYEEDLKNLKFKGLNEDLTR